MRFARACLLALPAVVGLGLVACGSSSSRDGFTTPDPGSSSGTSGAGTSGFIGAGDSGVQNTNGCSDEAKLVYVLSLEGDLYSFQPAMKKFTKVGPLDCQSGGKTFIPISMAVDRTATAWANLRENSPFATEDNMFKVDTKTAACTPTNIKGNIGGMGFSLDQGTTDKETLFVVGPGSTPTKQGLAKIDFAGERLVPIADLPSNDDPELTGTGDGRLFGFLSQAKPLALAQLDKSTSAYSNNVSLAKVPVPQAPMFAFTFWGGDFYFYTATGQSASTTTTVSRYRPSDKSLDNAYMTNIGFHIVGAGVSTCAPTTSVN